MMQNTKILKPLLKSHLYSLIPTAYSTTGWYNTHYIAGTGGLTSSVSTLFPEEAVNEVKRQAMSELQKAVSEAERKAHEMISSERAKMERTVAEAKRQAAEDALSIINQQEDSSEVRTCAYDPEHQKKGPLILQSYRKTVITVCLFNMFFSVKTLVCYFSWMLVLRFKRQISRSDSHCYDL